MSDSTESGGQPRLRGAPGDSARSNSGWRMGAKRLSNFSRRLATMLEAGLPIRRSLALLERQTRGGDRVTYRRLGQEIEQGRSFHEALRNQGRCFPVFFCNLVQVGESVGGLDKVLKRLAEYYEFVRAMWVRLAMRMIYPVLQFCALILILAIVTYIMGVLKQPPDENATAHAMRILIIGAIIMIAPPVAYLTATRLLSGARVVHEILMRIPILGMVMRTLALARFSWSMELMTDAGVNILNAVTWSADSTANGVFVARAQKIVTDLKEGCPLSEALNNSKLFPEDYIEVINVGETSGSMPEQFARLARMYFEKADSAIKTLTSAMAWLVYIAVGVVIIYYILQFAMMYVGAINGVLQGM